MSVTPLVTSAEVLAAWPPFATISALEQGNLINAASAAIDTACDRFLGAATYQEIHRPGRARKLKLKQYPVTDITRLATDNTTVLFVQNVSSTSTIQRATLKYLSSGPADNLTFTGISITSQSSGVVTTLGPYLFASYLTVTSLAAAIAANAGWTATITTGYEQWATADLNCEVGSVDALAVPSELKAFTRDLTYYLDVDSARQGIVEFFESRPDGFRYPDRMYARSFAGAQGLNGSDPRVGGILVKYPAGYATADVPDDLKRLTIGALTFLYNKIRKSGAVQSETIGDYSYTLAAANKYASMLPDWIQDGCDKYRRVEL